MRRALLSAALVAAATIGLTPHAARADDAAPAAPALTLATNAANGLSWIETFVDVPEARGAWTVDTRLADAPDKLAAATPREDTVTGFDAIGISTGESFATEGWQSHTVLTGGKRYWVEVTAHPSEDTGSPPVDVVGSIVAAPVPATTTIRPATPVDNVPAGARVQILGNVERTGACPDEWQPCGFRLTAALQARRAGTSTWTTVATSTMAPGLSLSAYVRLDRSADYRWFYGAVSPIDHAASPLLHIDAHANGWLTLPKTGTVGHAVRGSAHISPKDLGGRVTLQVLDGHWRTVTTGTVNSKGVARFLFTPKKSGTWKHRVHIAGRPDLLAGATYPVTMKVHRH